MNIETSEIRLAPKKLIGFLAMEYGMMAIGCAIVVALLLGAFALIFDARFWIVALIWIFIVIPMGLFLLFIIYGMLPLTSINTINHIIQFDKEKLYLHLPPPPLTEENANGIHPDASVTEIEYSLIQKINATSDSLVIFCNPPHKGLLWIPAYAFSSKEDFTKVFNQMKPYCKIKAPLTVDYENSER